jgi:homoserine dehydrogenase
MYHLAFIGFGTVGQGLAELLLKKEDMLREQYGFEAQVVAVSDMLKGAVYDPLGIDLGLLMETVQRTGRVDEYPRGTKGWDSLRTIRETNAEVVVEVTYTDVKTGEPALSHCRAAFEAGKHVVTTNKGPVALAYREMLSLAAAHNVQFRFEGTVMSGTPVLRLAQNALAGATIHGFRGILNGTTNYILTQMEEGQSYADSLKRAQELGYAEAVPDADVEGWDAVGKVVILANVLMNAELRIEDVEREGITGITQDDVAAARDAGERWKLIGSAQREGGRVVARVRPERLALADPLAGIGGPINAVTFETDTLGDVTLVGPGAGRTATGYALLGDLLDIHRRG